ncbi:MAG TPA: FtsX-like permease family protein [Cyclobacteriaceae bacterium]|nr:FtsX-like permease family protein [Cyclobacteriaceae bacterium]
MNLPLFIARRYFLSKRKTNFINIISVLSMVGVAFSTAALVIVLSVFNGLEGLLRSLYNSFDPEIKIEAAKGKSFEVDEAFLARLKSIENVGIVTEVIEDFALVRYRDSDIIVTMKGVSPSFVEQHRLDDSIVEGELKLQDKNGRYAILGRGVRYALSVPVTEGIYPLQVFYIKNAKTSSIDPSRLYTSRNIMPGGVFSIEKNIDENNIFLPLDFVVDLMDYGNKRTSLEIKSSPGADLKNIQRAIQKELGESFLVLTNDEQHKDLYRLLNLEKLFTFVSLTLLILIASINIFFSLMMLAIDKNKDLSILSAIGAQPQLIKKIFLSEGALIAFSGAITGLLLGGIVCWAQQQFGLVGMGMESAIVNAYPVEMRFIDFVSVAVAIIAITGLIAFYPAALASKSYSPQHL